MAQNFIESRREQGFLLPPDVREWLPADHLAWFVIDAVAEMDLSAFYAAYRADGHGRAAYEPSTDGGAGAVRVRGRAALLAGDRASLSPGRGLPGDHRQPDSRSRDDRALHLPARAGVGRAVRRGAQAVRSGGAGEAGRGVDRRHADRRQRQPGGQLQVRPDRQGDRGRGQGDRRGRGRALRRGAR